MAQPMFGALGGMTPDEMLRRLLMTGGQSDPQWAGQMDAPDQPGIVANQLAKPQPGAVAPVPPASAVAMAKLAAAPANENKAIGPLPEPLAQPPSTFPPSPQDAFEGAAGSSKSPLPSFMQSSQGSATAPPFTPFNFPPPAPYEPATVPNAVRTGMYNPAGANSWDRSMTATSAEDEHRLRQQAAYNNVLDLIRPGGIGMAGGTGPQFALQPHEIAALSTLGGQQAENLFKGRALAEKGVGDERDNQLKALIANQQHQTQLGVADITGKAHVAGAQAAHNPESLKAQATAQLIGQMIQGGADSDTIASHIGQYKSALNTHVGGAPGASPGVPTVPQGGETPQSALNDDEVNATRILNQSVGMLGQGKIGPEFKYHEGSGQADADKVLDFLASQKAAGKLTPGAMGSFARQVQRLPNFTKFRDNLVRSGAAANYQIQPPLDPKTGKPADFSSLPGAPPAYAVHDPAGAELYRYTHNANGTVVNEMLQRGIGNTGYNQIQLPNGAGAMDIDRSLLTPSVFANKLPRQTLEGRKATAEELLRALFPTPKNK